MSLVVFTVIYPQFVSILLMLMLSDDLGMVGGLVATCFNAPFDVVKSRFQSQLYVSIGSEGRFCRSLQTFMIDPQHSHRRLVLIFSLPFSQGAAENVPLKYRGTFQTLGLVYREEGARALYKG